MAKQLNEEAILNELHGESAFFKASPTPLQDGTPQEARGQKKAIQKAASKQASSSPVRPKGDRSSQLVDHAVDQAASRPTSRLYDHAAKPSTNEPSNSAIEQSGSTLNTGAFDMSAIVPRPKAFYISEKQDEEIDVLVKKLSDKVKGKVGQKIDRSVTTRLIFEHIGLTSDETAEQLAKLLIGRLTRQLTSQPED